MAGKEHEHEFLGRGRASARPSILKTQPALAAEGMELRVGQLPQRLKPLTGVFVTAGLKPRPFLCSGSLSGFVP